VNIFWFDVEDLRECAKAHPDKLLVKMPLEHCQLLAQALLKYNPKATIPKLDGTPYGETHTGHPCAIWTRYCRHNFNLLCDLTIALCDEYEFRYGKPSSFRKPVIEARKQADIIPDREPKGLAVAVNDFWLSCIDISESERQTILDNKIEVKDHYLVEDVYRQYLIAAKANYASWKTEESIPDWWPRKDGNGRLFCSLKYPNSNQSLLTDSYGDEVSSEKRDIFEKYWKMNCDLAQQYRISKIAKDKFTQKVIELDFSEPDIHAFIQANIASKAIFANIPGDLTNQLELAKNDLKQIRKIVKDCLGKKVPTYKTLETWQSEGTLIQSVTEHINHWGN
jgi:hypothetical protein